MVEPPDPVTPVTAPTVMPPVVVKPRRPVMKILVPPPLPNTKGVLAPAKTMFKNLFVPVPPASVPISSVLLFQRMNPRSKFDASVKVL
jgi:hypothetical protein